MSAKRAATTIVLTTVTLLGLSCVAGRVLPSPFSNIGPTEPHNMRVELVRDIVARSSTPCISVLGNSRVAFGVNTAQLSQPGCPVVNIAFAGLGVSELFWIADSVIDPARLKLLVFFLADDHMLVPAGSSGHIPIDSEPQLPYDVQSSLRRLDFVGLLPPRAAIEVRISNFRVAAMLSAPFGEGLWRTTPAFDWSLGRWRWPRLEGPIIDTLKDRDSVMKAVATEYYGNKRVHDRELVDARLRRLKSYSQRIIIVTPPQHPLFEKAIEQVSPGLQAHYLAMLDELTKEHGMTFIECTSAERCGGLSSSMFADPVHLTAEGAERFTRYLGERAGIIKTENR